MIVVSHSGSVPDGAIDYESLIADAEPMQWPELDERRAAACVTRRAPRGDPRACVYSHRSLVLHSLVSALPDALGDLRARHDPAGRADVPRQRLGAALHGCLRRCGLVLPGPKLDAE